MLITGRFPFHVHDFWSVELWTRNGNISFEDTSYPQWIFLLAPRIWEPRDQQQPGSSLFAASVGAWRWAEIRPWVRGCFIGPWPPCLWPDGISVVAHTVHVYTVMGHGISWFINCRMLFGISYLNKSNSYGYISVAASHGVLLWCSSYLTFE